MASKKEEKKQNNTKKDLSKYRLHDSEKNRRYTVSVQNIQSTYNNVNTNTIANIGSYHINSKFRILYPDSYCNFYKIGVDILVNYNSKNVLINILKTVFIAFFISISLVFMLPDTLTGKVYAETTTTYTQNDEEDEENKSPFEHLKEFRFGTGNFIVFVILIGILVGRKVKDYLNEKQKESK